MCAILVVLKVFQEPAYLSMMIRLHAGRQVSDSKARNVCHRIQTGAGVHSAFSIMGAAVSPL
jgi:hypothetical protein